MQTSGKEYPKFTEDLNQNASMVYDRSDDGSDPYHLQKSIEQPTGDFKYQFSTSSLKSFERDILETVHEQKPSIIGVDRRVSRECCALPQSFQSKVMSNKIPTKKFSKAKVQSIVERLQTTTKSCKNKHK